MEELREIPLDEMHEFAKEYRELAYTMPFQLPQDLIFLLRTIAILSGMCTGLDPKFNVWESITPYAGKLLAEEDGSSWDFLVTEVGAILQSLIALPRQLETALGKIERDELGVRAPMIELQVGKLELTMRRIVFAFGFVHFGSGTEILPSPSTLTAILSCQTSMARQRVNIHTAALAAL